MTIPHQSDRRKRPSREGFTLVELLMVALIISVLTGLVLGVARYANTKSSINQAKAELEMIRQALEEYRVDHGTYPIATGMEEELIDLESSDDFWGLKARGVNSNLVVALKGYLPDEVLKSENYTYVQGNSHPTISVTNKLVDPWGLPYMYENNGDNRFEYHLWSYGNQDHFFDQYGNSYSIDHWDEKYRYDREKYIGNAPPDSGTDN